MIVESPERGFLRVATYNVHNLVDTPQADNGKSDAAIRALLSTITALAADVLLLQEVGSSAVLRRLNATHTKAAIRENP